MSRTRKVSRARSRRCPFDATKAANSGKRGTDEAEKQHDFPGVNACFSNALQSPAKRIGRSDRRSANLGHPTWSPIGEEPVDRARKPELVENAQSVSHKLIGRAQNARPHAPQGVRFLIVADLEEPSASIAHARVCEGRRRPCYGDPYSGTKPETADTCQGGAYGRDSSSPTRKQITRFFFHD